MGRAIKCCLLMVDRSCTIQTQGKVKPCANNLKGVIVKRRNSAPQAESHIGPPQNTPDFIPLTQADLDRGLTKEQLAQLSSILNVKPFMQELYRLGQQVVTERQQRAEADDAA